MLTVDSIQLTVTTRCDPFGVLLKSSCRPQHPSFQSEALAVNCLQWVRVEADLLQHVARSCPELEELEVRAVAAEDVGGEQLAPLPASRLLRDAPVLAACKRLERLKLHVVEKKDEHDGNVPAAELLESLGALSALKEVGVEALIQTSSDSSRKAAVAACGRCGLGQAHAPRC